MDSSKATSSLRKIEDILRMLAVLNLTGYQYPKHSCVQDGAKFDFIVVGGGTAGCLIASRLVEEGNAKVLLIEAGGIPPFESELAGLYPYMKNSKYDWNFTSTCDGLTKDYHKNDVIHMSQGKMLGGSGFLNYGAYTRGYPQDYDEWAAITNDTSWSFKSIEPLLKRTEKLTDRRILKTNHSYGTKGKMQIFKKYYKRNRFFFNALQEIGYQYHLDINPDHPLGFTNNMFNIGLDGKRQTTAGQFLSPLKKNKKLHIMLNTLATKIVFNDKRTAIGVEVITEDKKKLIIKARKEVIVTAGTFKSPQLLMLSGIGPKDHLQNKDIKVISDLPVGKNFRDHVNSILTYKITKSSLAADITDPHLYPFVTLDGYVALNKSQCYPDYQTIGLHFGNTQSFLGLCAFIFQFDDELCDTLNRGIDGHEVFFVVLTYLNPKSKGEILLLTANPNDNPMIVPGYYTNEVDLKNHASYLADFNRIIDTTYFKSVDAELVDPMLKSCEGLERGTEEFWRHYTLGTSDTAHYYIGTCSMGTVVDSKLKVYGVKRLRVADASVMPTNMRGLIQASVMMIAQKASDMIMKDWRLN